MLALPAFAPFLLAEESAPARARQMISDLRSAQRAPGMCAAVWKRGALVWSEAFGESDIEDHAGASVETRFRIGSLSKLLTAAAAARLFESGSLDLDAPVQ